MQVYIATGKQYGIKQLAKSCVNQSIYHIREGKTILYLANNGHSQPLDLARDFNCHIREYGEEPASITAVCGSRMTPANLIPHERACNSCRSINGRPAKAVRATTVVSVPGIPSMDLAGMLQVMRERLMEVWTLYESYDLAVQALTRLDETASQLVALQAQAEKDREALAYFMQNPK